MSLKSGTCIFDEIYVQQVVHEIQDHEWLSLGKFFLLLQTKSTLIHNLVKGKGKECSVYDILASIFFHA
jgi:hypothetical protein